MLLTKWFANHWKNTPKLIFCSKDCKLSFDIKRKLGTSWWSMDSKQSILPRRHLKAQQENINSNIPWPLFPGIAAKRKYCKDNLQCVWRGLLSNLNCPALPQSIKMPYLKQMLVLENDLISYKAKLMSKFREPYTFNKNSFRQKCTQVQ